MDYSSMADLAKRLIGENGRLVTFVKYGVTLPDPAQPWTGPADPRAQPLSSVELYALAVDPGSASRYGISTENSDLVRLSSRILVMAPGAASTVDLEAFDEVVDEGARWRVVKVETLRPASVTLLHYVGLKQ